MTDCNFSANYGGGMYNRANISTGPTVTNCILWGNTPDEIYNDPTSSATVTYSDIQGGRQDGIGNFYRVYNWHQVPEVTVTAPETYGNWRFDKWTDKDGYTLGYGPTLEFEFLPHPDDNPTVWAEYVYEGPILSIADFDEDYDVDFEDYAALSRVWLTEPADPEWDPVYDVSDPPDDYIDWRDVAVLCENWLATP